ncbi:MFS transporter [Georgenia yuyongxinii]|uniref:MFS transporter n=1 Tax=Georgenia yuyongxinii TaxID=2589797 RepID=UPI00362D1C12
MTTVLIGLSLRGPIVGIPPLIGRIGAELELTGTAAGLITSLPLVCFAVGSPLVALLARRLGLDRTLLVALVVLGLAVALRPWGGLPLLLAGTVLVGLAITVGNVLLPVLVRRDAGGRTKGVMAASTSSYGLGAALAAAVAVPMAGSLGWRGATASLAVLVALALVMWLVRMRRGATGPGGAGSGRGRAGGVGASGAGPAGSAASAPAATSATSGTAAGSAAAAGAERSVWTMPSAWWLALFFGLQAALFYSVSAWLPPMLVDEAGVSEATAGTAVSLFHLLGILGTLAVPAMLSWFGDARRVGLIIAAGWVVLLLGVVLLPGTWLLWVVVGGVAQGAGIGLGLTLVAVRPVDVDYGRSLSAMVQGAGYGLAAVGPVLIGWLASSTDGWALPVTVLVAAAVALGLAGLFAGNERPIGVPRG